MKPFERHIEFGHALEKCREEIVAVSASQNGVTEHSGSKRSKFRKVFVLKRLRSLRKVEPLKLLREIRSEARLGCFINCFFQNLARTNIKRLAIVINKLAKEKWHIVLP